VRLYVDEDTASRQLIARLRSAGHDVIQPQRGRSDAHCWQQAQDARAGVLTTNARDFISLAAIGPHAGLLLVYRENDPTRDMTAKSIATAVDLVVEAYADGIADRIIVLNAFRR
jgi:hypothetical protein